MVSEILMILICVTILCFGGVKQSQAYRIVFRLVPAIFRIIEHRHTITAVTVTKVGPFSCRHLICGKHIIAALDHTDTEIVCCLIVRYRKRELCLHKCICGSPIHLIHKVDTGSHGTLIKIYILRELRVAILLRNLDTLHQVAILDKCDRHIFTKRNGLRINCFLCDFPRRPRI